MKLNLMSHPLEKSLQCLTTLTAGSALELIGLDSKKPKEIEEILNHIPIYINSLTLWLDYQSAHETIHIIICSIPKHITSLDLNFDRDEYFVA